jgi:hypothetical protein
MLYQDAQADTMGLLPFAALTHESADRLQPQDRAPNRSLSATVWRCRKSGREIRIYSGQHAGLAGEAHAHCPHCGRLMHVQGRARQAHGSSRPETCLSGEATVWAA